MEQLEQLSLFDRSPQADSGASVSNTAAQRMRQIELSGQSVDWRLERTRRKTVGMLVEEGYIRVRAPRWVSLDEIESILRGKARWLTARLREAQLRRANRIDPADRWIHGGQVQFLGQTLRICLQPEMQDISWDASEGRLMVPMPTSSTPDQVRDRVHGWLQMQAGEILLERLDHISTRASRQYTRFSLSHARTRWGSCTQDGHIRLNWRLVQFSLPIIDYVVAHELAHLHAMDHSTDFWSEVARIFPDFESGRQRIKGVPLEDH